MIFWFSKKKKKEKAKMKRRKEEIEKFKIAERKRKDDEFKKEIEPRVIAIIPSRKGKKNYRNNKKILESENSSVANYRFFSSTSHLDSEGHIVWDGISKAVLIKTELDSMKVVKIDDSCQTKGDVIIFLKKLLGEDNIIEYNNIYE